MDDADVVAYTTLTEQYLRRFGNFVENHFLTLVRAVSEDVSPGETAADRSLGSSGEFGGSFEGDGSGGGVGSSVTLHTCSRHIWEKVNHPVRVHWTPAAESASFEELTCIPHPLDGNPDVQKVMLVLVTITAQARSLRETGERRFVNALVLYGDCSFEGDASGELKDSASLSETEGDGHLAVAKLLPLLLDLVEFVGAVSEFTGGWLEQVGALFKESKPHVVSIANLQLHSVFRELSDLLAMLVVLDEVVRSQTVLQEHWKKFRQMITGVRADSRSFATDPESLMQLERQLFHVDRALMQAHIFPNFVDTVLQAHHRQLGKNLLLADKFLCFVNALAAELDRSEALISDANAELRPISLAAMYMFAGSLFPGVFEPKRVFHKGIWEQLKKIHAVALPGANVWIPEHFLNSLPPPGGHGGSKLFDHRTLQALSTARNAFLTEKVASLPREMLLWNLQLSSWTVRLQEVLYAKDLSSISLQDLSRKCTLLVEGLKLAHTLSHTFRLLLNLHAALGRPIGKAVVVHLCQMLELLKSVEATFFRFSARLVSSSMYILQYVSHTALVQVRNAQKYILNSNDMSRGRVDEIRADALSVLKILEHTLRATLTPRRFLVAQVAMEWACSANTAGRLWKDEETSRIIPAAFERLGQLLHLEGNVERFCDTSSVFFHRVILSTYFSSLYAQPHHAPKLPLVFTIIHDCLRYLRSNSPSGEENQAETAFLTEIESYLKTRFVDRLCRDVETDLRLLGHTHLQQPDPLTPTSQNTTAPAPPFRTGVPCLEGILETPAFSWDTRQKVALGRVVEEYLSRTYYNLASVALHDWQSYATMRALAASKYRLQVLDDHLPGHSLEQGRDVLEIVRNLGQFVTEFTYNLNHQVFVQVASPNKHLDTVSIRHLANSLRTHGPGMANTVINAAYKFLRAKITALSAFLYNEQIKSRLAKDLRLFRQSSQSLEAGAQNVAYATLLFERANKFKKGIRKLGVNQDGLSPLDQFRILVSHIGNALGFVRLVRSGGSHYLAGGYQFVPDLQDITPFTELLECSGEEALNSSFTGDIKTAASSIDAAIKTLSTSFSDGVDYFKLLINAFQPALLEPKNAHLRHFYGIIPALTLSYVDHMRLCKEKLAKRSKVPSIFTDDGFPMGLAYLLQVLDQGTHFDSLAWFSHAEFYFLRERNIALKAIQDSKRDEKLQQANTLTAKRFWDVLNEFQLVRYNLSSARIFFHHDSSKATATPT